MHKGTEEQEYDVYWRIGRDSVGEQCSTVGNCLDSEGGK